MGGLSEVSLGALGAPWRARLSGWVGLVGSASASGSQLVHSQPPPGTSSLSIFLHLLVSVTGLKFALVNFWGKDFIFNFLFF